MGKWDTSSSLRLPPASQRSSSWSGEWVKADGEHPLGRGEGDEGGWIGEDIGIRRRRKAKFKVSGKARRQTDTARYRDALASYALSQGRSFGGDVSSPPPAGGRRVRSSTTPPAYPLPRQTATEPSSWALSLASNLLTSVGIRPESVDVDVTLEEEYVRRLTERITRERHERGMSAVNEDGGGIRRGEGRDRRGTAEKARGKFRRKSSGDTSSNVSLPSSSTGDDDRHDSVEMSLFSVSYVAQGHKEVIYGYGDDKFYPSSLATGVAEGEDNERASIYDSSGGIRAYDRQRRAFSTPDDGGRAWDLRGMNAEAGVSNALGRSVLLRTRSENNFVGDVEWMDCDTGAGRAAAARVGSRGRGGNAFDSEDDDEERGVGSVIRRVGDDDDDDDDGWAVGSEPGEGWARQGGRDLVLVREDGSSSLSPSQGIRSGSVTPRRSGSVSPRRSGSRSPRRSEGSGSGARISEGERLERSASPTAPHERDQQGRRPVESLPAQAATQGRNAPPPSQPRVTFQSTILAMHPHSAAAYLRAMSVFGFGSLIFLLHTMVWWLTEIEAQISGPGDALRLLLIGPEGCGRRCRLRWHWLSFSIVMGVMKLPFRMATLAALNSVQSRLTRDESRAALEAVVKGWKFGVHKILGRVAQLSVLAGFFIVVAFGGGEYDDGISEKAALDASCANLLVSILRVVLAVGVLYTHEVRQRRRLERLRSARQRRGLLEREMEALRKETYESAGDSHPNLEAASRQQPRHGSSSTSDSASSSSGGFSNKPSCSICLERFVRGDRLWILPCDDRHKFHGDCIKAWLAKNESCPLCTRSVRGEEVRDSDLERTAQSTDES